MGADGSGPIINQNTQSRHPQTVEPNQSDGLAAIGDCRCTRCASARSGGDVRLARQGPMCTAFRTRHGPHGGNPSGGRNRAEFVPSEGVRQACGPDTLAHLTRAPCWRAPGSRYRGDAPHRRAAQSSIGDRTPPRSPSRWHSPTAPPRRRFRPLRPGALAPGRCIRVRAIPLRSGHALGRRRCVPPSRRLRHGPRTPAQSRPRAERSRVRRCRLRARHRHRLGGCRSGARAAAARFRSVRRWLPKWPSRWRVRGRGRWSELS